MLLDIYPSVIFVILTLYVMMSLHYESFMTYSQGWKEIVFVHLNWEIEIFPYANLPNVCNYELGSN